MAEINIERTTPNINIDTATRTYHLPIASAVTLGGIKVGDNLTIEPDGTLNAATTQYNLPVASSSTLGGIKIGNGLTISTAGSLSTVVDSSLDADSTNPVRNSVVTSNINTLTTAVQEAGSNITGLSTTVGNLSSTVSSHTSSISTLSNTVNGHTSAIQTNTDDITILSSSVSNNTYSIGELDTRLTNAEDSITTLNNSVSPLVDNDATTLAATDVLPASTWTTGNINVIKRGNIGYIFIDLEGSLTIAADSREVLYTFSDIIPLVKTNSTLLTDDGAVIGEFNDYDYKLSLVNMDANQSVTITKIKGCIPFVFA